MSTGLNFQTQTIINTNVDIDSNGKPLFTTAGTTVRVKRGISLKKEGVLAIRKRAGYNPVKCKAEINFNDFLTELKGNRAKTYCRLDVYLGVEGAEPFIYSTPWVQKGIPFWIDFTVKSTDSASTIAETLKKELAKNHTFQQDKDLINVSVEGGKLVLEGADEYQRFRTISVNIFEETAEYGEKVAEIGDGVTVVEYGKNGFGTYSHIVKDLRLPTAANTGWLHIRQSETPIVGAIYNQYIVEYVAPSTNDGLHAVGQKLDSHTTHVFWVKNDAELISSWEEALAVLGSVEDVDGELSE